MTAIPTLIILALLPLASCPSCGDAYQLRIGYSRLPGITAAEAASLRNYADAQGCGRCNGKRRISWSIRELTRSQDN